MMAELPDQSGLQWVENEWGRFATFARGPNMARAEQVLMTRLGKNSVKFSWLAGGANNKVYDVICDDEVKIESEKDGKQLVESSTKVPVESDDKIKEEATEDGKQLLETSMKVPVEREDKIKVEAAEDGKHLLQSLANVPVESPGAFDVASNVSDTRTDEKNAAIIVKQTDAKSDADDSPPGSNIASKSIMSIPAWPLIFRVILPIEPKYKTLSEVATMRWVRHNTSIPVPTVIAYDESSQNPVGFEWIVMTKMPGKPLAELWRTLSMSAKETLTRQVAGFEAELFNRRLSGIGNLYGDAAAPEIGRNVLGAIENPSPGYYKLPRGPHRSAGEWLQAAMDLREHKCLIVLKKYAQATTNIDSGDDEVTAELALKIIKNLRPIVDAIFPADQGFRPVPSVIHHQDLSENNILVDHSGAVTGVIDWEFMSTLPVWTSCGRFPRFLGFPNESRDEARAALGLGLLPQPDPTGYARDDTGQLCNLYWNHLKEWECDRLRLVFSQEMGKLSPEWESLRKSSSMKLLRKLEAAVGQCEDTYNQERNIKDWIETFKDDWRASDWHKWMGTFGLGEL